MLFLGRPSRCFDNRRHISNLLFVRLLFMRLLKHLQNVYGLESIAVYYTKFALFRPIADGSKMLVRTRRFGLLTWCKGKMGMPETSNKKVERGVL